MKKLVIVFICLIALCGCGKKEMTNNNDKTQNDVVENNNKDENNTVTGGNSEESNSDNNSQNNTTTDNSTDTLAPDDKTNDNKLENTTSNNKEENKVEDKKEEEKPTCTAKKFSEKYKYFYATEDECKKESQNTAFFDITDNVDDRVFTVNCEKIVDDCGTTWYGVSYNIYDPEHSDREDGVVVVHY